MLLWLENYTGINLLSTYSKLTILCMSFKFIYRCRRVQCKSQYGRIVASCQYEALWVGFIRWHVTNRGYKVTMSRHDMSFMESIIWPIKHVDSYIHCYLKNMNDWKLYGQLICTVQWKYLLFYLYIHVFEIFNSNLTCRKNYLQCLSFRFGWLSEWLLFNINTENFQLYHGENKLIFNNMMMRSALF